MTRLLLALVGLLALGLPAPASADHPTVCLGALDGEALVPLTRNLPQPFCTEAASGERVTWVNLDVLALHAPRDVRESGTCFSVFDTGDYLRGGERYSVEFTWLADEERLRIRAWDDAGVLAADRTCHPNVHVVEPDGTITVWWESFGLLGAVHVSP